MLCLFIDEDFIEVRVSRNGVLTVAHDQSRNISFREGPPQSPDGGGGAEDVANIIIAYNQNFLNLAWLKRGLSQRPAPVNSKVKYFF